MNKLLSMKQRSKILEEGDRSTYSPYGAETKTCYCEISTPLKHAKQIRIRRCTFGLAAKFPT